MNKIELEILQGLPLDVKILKTKQRIREFIDLCGRDSLFISYSGGKDSCVLADLVRQVELEMFGNNEIPLVFCDTGLEYPDLKEHVSNQTNVIVIKPQMSFNNVIAKYGYPVVSKEVSHKIFQFKNYNLSDSYRHSLLHGSEKGRMAMIPKKWQYLLDDCDFSISSTCCDIMKKRPFKKFQRITQYKNFFTGEMASESRLRQTNYLRYGCNNFERKDGSKSTPLGFWTEQDIYKYIIKNKITIPRIYGDIIKKHGEYITTNVNRTGCVFCLYGVHLEPENNNRFTKLKKDYPLLYNYCINGGTHEDGKWVPDKGLGMGHVLDKINVNYRGDNNG